MSTPHGDPRGAPPGDPGGTSARAEPAPRAVPRRRRWVRAVLLLALLLVTGLALLWLGRNRVVAPFLLDRLRPRIAAALGGDLTVERFGGSWIGGLELEGVRFRRSGTEGPLVALEGGRLSARYSLLALARGDLDGLKALTVRADRLLLAPAASPAATEAPGAPSGGAAPALPAHLPALALDVTRLELLASDGTGPEPPEARLDGLRLATPGPDRLHLTAERADLSTLLPRLAPGALSLDLSWDRGHVAVEGGALGDAVALAPGSVDLPDPLDTGTLRWDLGLHLPASSTGAPEVLARGSLAQEPGGTAAVEGHVEVSALALDALTPFWPAELEPPAGTLALGLDFTGPPGEPEHLEGSLALDAREVRLLGRSVDTLTAKGTVADGTVRLETLAVAAGEDALHASALTLPLVADARTLATRSSGDLDLTLRDVPAVLALAGAPLTAEERAEVPAHELTLSAHLADGALSLRAGSAVAAGGRLDLERGSLRLADDPARWLEDAALDVDLRVDVPDLAAVGRVLGRDDLAGGAAGTLRLAGTASAPVGQIACDLHGVAAAGVELGDATLAARSEGTLVRVDSLALSGPRWHVEGSGAWDRASGELSGVMLDARLPDLAALLPGTFERGTGTLHVTADGPPTTPEGTLAASVDGASIDGLAIDTAALAADLHGTRATVHGLTGTVAGTAVDAHGSVQRGAGWATWDVALEALTLAREGRSLALEAPARVSVAPDAVAVDRLALAGEAGRLELAGSVSTADGTGQATLAFHDLDALGLAGPLLAERLPEGFACTPLDGELRASRVAAGANAAAPGAPGLELAARLDVAACTPAKGTPPWRVHLDGKLDSGQLDLAALELAVADDPGHGSLTARGTAPLDPLGPALLPDGPVDLTLKASAPMLASWPPALLRALSGGTLAPAGSLALDLRLGGTWRATTGRVTLDGEGLAPGPALGDLPVAPVAATLAVSLGDVARVEAGSVRFGAVGAVGIEGTVGAPLDLAALARGETAPLLGAPLQAKVHLDVPDVEPLARALPGVRRASGALAAELTGSGPLGAPELAGTVEAKALAVRPSSAFPALQDLNAELALDAGDGGRVRVESFAGLVGGAPFQLQGSVADLSSAPTLDLTLAGDGLLLYRTVGTRVRADTQVSLRGPLDALAASGTLTLEEGRYGEPIELFSGLSGEGGPPSSGPGLDLALAREGPAASMKLDLTVRAKEPFRVETNLVKGGLRPSLHVGGTGAVPLLDGSVFLDPTSVSLPSGRMQVDSGRVTFDERDPFVPRLELNGHSRLRGYDVQAVITGPYDDPEIRLSSTPPLPNQDLLVLFLTGQLPEGTAAERGRGAAQSVAVYLAQDYLTRWLSGGGDGSDDSILKRIDFSIGGDVTRSGSLTTEVTYLLTRRAEGPGTERYLVGERDVYDKINFGYGIRFKFE